MKLNESNSRFAIVRTAFHCGGTVSFHTSLKEAIKADRNTRDVHCSCGCCAIVPITKEAKAELIKANIDTGFPTLYDDLPYYSANGESYSKICRN